MAVFETDDLADWSGGRWEPAAPVRVRGVSNDTRTLEDGNLYFALEGEHFDGHDFVADAFAKGAAAAVVARDRAGAQLQRPATAPLLIVSDTRKALMDIAAGHRDRVDPEIVGVTGSVGKSTVKEMTARMLGRSRETAFTRGNWNNDIGLPLSILGMEASTNIGVFEVGTNHPGEVAELCGVLKPSSGVVTNVGPVHIENFDSVEDIAREKGSLLACLPGDGFAVLDSGADFLEILRSMCGAKIIMVGRRRGQDDYACLHSDSAGGRFTVLEKATGEEALLRNTVPGRHNIINALFAVAVARTYGISWQDIEGALAAYDPLPMRWQRTRVRWSRDGEDGSGSAPIVGIVNDAYNANPLSMRAAVNAFVEQACEGRKWLVLGDMLELGASAESEHEALGRFVAETVAKEPERWGGMVATGELGKAIAEGAAAAGMRDRLVAWCGEKGEAYEVLSKHISSGDDLLLKASRGVRLEELLEGTEEMI